MLGGVFLFIQGIFRDCLRTLHIELVCLIRHKTKLPNSTHMGIFKNNNFIYIPNYQILIYIKFSKCFFIKTISGYIAFSYSGLLFYRFLHIEVACLIRHKKKFQNSVLLGVFLKSTLFISLKINKLDYTKFLFFHSISNNIKKEVVGVFILPM